MLTRDQLAYTSVGSFSKNLLDSRPDRELVKSIRMSIADLDTAKFTLGSRLYLFRKKLHGSLSPIPVLLSLL